MVIKELAIANKVVYYKGWFPAIPVIFVPLDLLTRPYTILVLSKRFIKTKFFKVVVK